MILTVMDRYLNENDAEDGDSTSTDQVVTESRGATTDISFGDGPGVLKCKKPTFRVPITKNIPVTG